jgi:hypothetical protein
MLSPAVLIALLLLILLTIWAGASLRTAYDGGSAVLRQARGQLDRLKLEAVHMAEDDQTVQEVFDQIAVDSSSIGRAWQDFASTVVVVDGRPGRPPGARRSSTPTGSWCKRPSGGE